MSNEQILFNTCSFFASESWWKPIISFLYSNNGDFKSEYQTNRNDSTKSFTHEQYAKFTEFTNMVIDLVDKNLCSRLGINDKMLENILTSTYEEGNIQSHVVIDTLQKTLNFFDFKDEMTRCNIRTEELINEAIIDITTSKSVNMNDPEEFAKKVAEITQNKIDHEVNELVQKGCRQMRALLDVDLIKSNVPGTPQRRPLPVKSSPDRANNNEQQTSIQNQNKIPTPETPPIHVSNENSNVKIQASFSGRRNVVRPPPINSKIRISKLSLNSSSSSNYYDNDDDEYYSSASSSPPVSPSRTNSARSAPQSPFLSQNTRLTPKVPQSPPVSNSNTATNSPQRSARPLLVAHNNNDDTNIDQEDVERRRQFYIKQRDILAKKEHRKPPSHAIVKPVHRKIQNASPVTKQRKYYRKIDE